MDPGFKQRGGVSEENAYRYADFFAQLQARVADDLWHRQEWCTAQDIADSLHEAVGNVRPRLSELWRDGKVDKQGGRPALWRWRMAVPETRPAQLQLV
jgi:hypothetical protein